MDWFFNILLFGASTVHGLNIPCVMWKKSRLYDATLFLDSSGGRKILRVVQCAAVTMVTCMDYEKYGNW